MDGMQFFTQREHRRIINWPRRHYDNGVAKNAATEGSYKQTVRVFKNFRNYLYDNGGVPNDSVPSYFVESLIYNVPNSEFSATSHTLSVLSVLLWLTREHEEGRFPSLVCGNGFVPLFGASPEQWDAVSAQGFVTACISAWASW